ncbi:MAG: PAS domain S-box protein, partial [Smithella sp.]|nr:PAS domain S-box protein [Smithella sp.]
QRLLTGEQVIRTEYSLKKLDGSEFPAIVISSLIYVHGKPVGVRGAIVDITEHKRSEELLKKSEEKYRLLADHMKDQVWLMDLDLKWTYISPSMEKLLGYTLEELIQLPLDKLLTATSLQKAMEHFSIQMSKALPISTSSSLKHLVELEFICKNGQTLWGECSFSFIRDENGKPLSILGEGRDITERKRAEDKLQHIIESLEKAVGATIQVLVSVLEARDPYTAGHQSRVTNLASAIATEMGIDKEKIEGIRMAGSIHDIGKLSIPAEILTKPTKLTDIEFSLIKVHSQTGYDMLKNVGSPWSLAQIVHQHHERMNGSGYPRNLKVDEILMEARILAVADVVEAMASHRPYRASLGIEKALEEIEKNKGMLYDESVVNACLKLFREKDYELK